MDSELASRDPVFDAVENLLAVLDDIGRQRQIISRQAAAIRRKRAQGVPFSVVVSDEVTPLIAIRGRDCLKGLAEASARLQRAEARALHAEGLSMERIATLFGLTRQRIADFLRTSPADAD